MTTSWTNQELERLGDAEELEITSRRQDGSLREYTTLWVVRVGDEIFVRSARGLSGGWYRHAMRAGAGRIRVGDIAYDVAFLEPRNEDSATVDQAYRVKYSRSPLLHFLVSPAETALLQIEPIA
jgi:hypothetical protein